MPTGRGSASPGYFFRLEAVGQPLFRAPMITSRALPDAFGFGDTYDFRFVAMYLLLMQLCLGNTRRPGRRPNRVPDAGYPAILW